MENIQRVFYINAHDTLSGDQCGCPYIKLKLITFIFELQVFID